jgi:hypothetical protein
MTARWPHLSRAVLPTLLALVVAGVALGQALGSGLVLSYDLVWSPDPRLTPFATGLDTPAPRAVPSDALAVVLGQFLTPAIAQKLVLAGVLVLAGLGAVALVRHLQPRSGLLAACAAVLAAMWNPFVAERLVIGQWTVLLGYAVLPWAARAALCSRAGRGSVTALCGWGVMAAAGGANSLVIVAPATAAVLLLPRPSWRALLGWLVTVVGGAAAWALPVLLRGVTSDSQGFTAFAARADTPLGLALSLAGGGGFWNPAAYPAERSVGVLAVAGAALATVGLALVAVRAVRTSAADEAAGRSLFVLLAAAVVGFTLALVSGTPGLHEAWALLADLPGGALVRDAQKLVALWVVLGAVGVGLLVDALARRGAAFVVPALALTAVAPLLLPSLAWGVHGRLDAVQVPADLREAATLLSRSADGDVALLPWRQYRRYAWNDRRVSLSLVPRMVDRTVLYDDSLPLSTGRIGGEDARSAEVTAAIDGGADPWSAVRAQRVRYVVVEKAAGIDVPAVPADAGRVLLDSEHVLVVEVASPAASAPNGSSQTSPAASRAGWGVTLLTLAAWLVMAARRGLRGRGRPGPNSLVGFRP